MHLKPGQKGTKQLLAQYGYAALELTELRAEDIDRILVSPAELHERVVALGAQITADHFITALSHPDAFGSIRNSLGLSTASMLLDVSLGLVIGYLIVRTSIRGRARAGLHPPGTRLWT